MMITVPNIMHLIIFLVTSFSSRLPQGWPQLRRHLRGYDPCMHKYIVFDNVNDMSFILNYMAVFQANNDVHTLGDSKTACTLTRFGSGGCRSSLLWTSVHVGTRMGHGSVTTASMSFCTGRLGSNKLDVRWTMYSFPC